MYFIAGIVVGSVIGFMFAWFLFSWLTAKGEIEHYSQSSLSEDGDIADTKDGDLADCQSSRASFALTDTSKEAINKREQDRSIQKSAGK
jgi:hypothetical protein